MYGGLFKMKSYQNKCLTPKERAQSLLGEMTIKEKVGQLNQRLYGFSSYVREGDNILLTDEFKSEVDRWSGLGLLYGLQRADPWSAKTFTTGLDGKLAVRAYNQVQRYVIEHSRLGIPVLMCEECPHGHQALDGYLLPVNLALGSTWNPELVGKAFSVCADQLAGLRVDFALVSMLDILRDPRWGRSEECYSEDPYLAAQMAKAVVEGFVSRGVDVVAKHCCAQGETTGGVNASAARIGEREVREIHLPAVKAAVGAGARGVMAAYNEIEGIPCHANPWLLKDVLRGEFGFEGVVMADGCAVDQLGILAESTEAQGALALNSGVDVSLWDKSFTTLEKTVEQGLVSEKRLDEAVLRVLTMKFERGLFDNPYIEEDAPKKYTIAEHPETLEAARESVILLKNEDRLLPLSDNDMVAVIGPLADDVYAQLGDYTAPQRPDGVMTILDGVRKTAVKPVLNMTEPFPADEDEQKDYIDKAVRTVLQADKAVVVLGGSSSRFYDMVFGDNGAVTAMGNHQKYLNLTDCGEGVDISDINLPAWQLELLEAVHGTGKPVITVILAGRPYAMDLVSKCSDALCCAFYPGPAGGQAIAEVLFGKVNPSGRLPVSLPHHAGQIPVYYNHRASYNARYSDCPAGAAYPFGYGLSYVPFVLEVTGQSDDTLTSDAMAESGFTLSLTVRNDGDMDGIATPQLFIRDRRASVVPRVRMLKAFARVPLKPHEEKVCTLSLSADDLKVWNREMRYVLEPGVFDLFLYEGEKMHWRGTLEIRDTL